jgi:hypothetical protein
MYVWCLGLYELSKKKITLTFAAAVAIQRHQRSGELLLLLNGALSGNF